MLAAWTVSQACAWLPMAEQRPVGQASPFPFNGAALRLLPLPSLSGSIPYEAEVLPCACPRRNQTILLPCSSLTPFARFPRDWEERRREERAAKSRAVEAAAPASHSWVQTINARDALLGF